MDKFYAGTSGIVLPVANKQAFPSSYRDKSRLSYYASLFNSLEVNSSFYRIPMAATTRRWAAEVSHEFKFTFKLFKGITHNKALVFDEALVKKFIDVIDEVGEKKGALLIQFPASTIVDCYPQLEKLLTCIREYDPRKTWNICVEFRHPSWYREETFNLLAAYNTSMVIHDMPRSVPPRISSSSHFEYLRFHGPMGDYKGGYTDAVLKEYAEHINDWLKEGKTVYTYFNNTIGDALKNLLTIRSMLVE